MYKNKILRYFLLTLLLCGSALAADEVTLRPDHPDKHVVVKGDTLWDISAMFLKEPWYWPSIWQANPQVENPHLIYPGDVLRLVYIDGEPKLVVSERGSGPKETIKLTPQGREIPLSEAIPTIPLDAIRQFLSKPRIVGKDELEKAPYIVSSGAEHLIAASEDKVYIRGIKDDSVKSFAVVRAGETYVDPDTKKVLGYEAMFIGDAKLLRTGDPATVKLFNTKREVLIGDRLLPHEDDPYNAHFQPRAPEQAISGRILAVVDGVSQIGQHQVVVINRGSREGIEPGHVLAVYQKGLVVRDTVSKKRNETVTLPEERAGTLMVFRTFEKVSYGLIMKAQTNMHVLDIVRNP